MLTDYFFDHQKPIIFLFRILQLKTQVLKNQSDDREDRKINLLMSFKKKFHL